MTWRQIEITSLLAVPFRALMTCRQLLKTEPTSQLRPKDQFRARLKDKHIDGAHQKHRQCGFKAFS